MLIAFLCGVIALIFVRFAPGVVWQPLGLAPAMYFCMSLLVMLVGFMTAMHFFQHRNSVKDNFAPVAKVESWQLSLIFLLFFLNLVATVEKYDELGLKVFSIDAINQLRLERARDDVQTIGSGLFGVLSSATSGIVFFLVAAVAVKVKERKQTWHLWCAIAAATVVGLLNGGRFILFILVLSLLLHFRGEVGRLVPRKQRVLAYGSIIIVCCLWVAEVFALRIEYAGYEHGQWSLYMNRELGGFSLTPAAANFLDSSQRSVSLVYLLYLMLVFYIGHGVHEFVLLFEYASNGWLAVSWGGYQLYPFVPALQLIGLPFTGIAEIQASLPKIGVYTTLLGPMLVDFGLMGAVLAMWFLGLVFGWLSGFRRRGLVAGAVYFAIGISFACAPIVGMLGTSITPSILALAIFFALAGGIRNLLILASGPVRKKEP